MQRCLFLATGCLAAFLTSAAAQPRIVAHRGYWRCEGSAQNSLTSLRKAAELGVDASEFDVWLTLDGVPVVFHDAVWEGLRIEDTPYPELMNRRLPNGEFLPTLQQYLQLGKALAPMQLVLEVKTHRTDERNLQAAVTCLEIVRALEMEQQVDYIAFSRYVCQQLHALAPTSKIAYLNGDLSPQEVLAMGLTGIDYHYRKFRDHPEWIAQARELGVEVNVWTVDGTEALGEFARIPGIDLITTNDPHLLLEVVAPSPLPARKP